MTSTRHDVPYIIGELQSTLQALPAHIFYGIPMSPTALLLPGLPPGKKYGKPYKTFRRLLSHQFTLSIWALILGCGLGTETFYNCEHGAWDGVDLFHSLYPSAIVIFWFGTWWPISHCAFGTGLAPTMAYFLCTLISIIMQMVCLYVPFFATAGRISSFPSDMALCMLLCLWYFHFSCFRGLIRSGKLLKIFSGYSPSSSMDRYGHCQVIQQQAFQQPPLTSVQRQTNEAVPQPQAFQQTPPNFVPIQTNKVVPQLSGSQVKTTLAMPTI